MTTPNTNLQISNLAEEFTQAGVGVRARARCSWTSPMLYINSPVWINNTSENWVALILDSVAVAPDDAHSDLEGAHFVKPGMIVDERDTIFGGKKVVSNIKSTHSAGSGVTQIIILRPALTSSQISAAQNYNRSTGYWMNFWSGKMSSYTKGIVSSGSASVPGSNIANAGLIPDLPSSTFAKATPSSHSSSPGEISMGDFANRTTSYSASYVMPTISGSFVENSFGALPTASKQTRLSNVYSEFTIPDTTGVDYEVTIGNFMYGIGGRWRSYTRSSYYGYGGGTEYWYSYWENLGWAIYDVTSGSTLHGAYEGTNSHTVTNDSNIGTKITGSAQTLNVTPGRTYRMYYRATYWQSSGMGDPEQDMLFIATNNSWSITRSSDNAVVASDTGTKPSISVRAKLGNKWKSISSNYSVPSATGAYNPVSKQRELIDENRRIFKA